MHQTTRRALACAIGCVALTGMALTGMAPTGVALANESSPPGDWQQSVEAMILPDVARIVDAAIVEYAILAQNTRYGDAAQDTIDALDAQWRSEHDRDEQPLISAVLSNPASSYLTRVQALSVGLYTEIFVMDRNGLNVGQSNISSDFWQGDEDKFQQTYDNGAGALFVDEAEFRDDIGVWVAQVNVTIDQDGVAIGAATFEVNLTELTRRQSALAALANEL